MDWDIPCTSTTFTTYLRKAHQKLVYNQELTEIDELILELAGVIMELYDRATFAEKSLMEVCREMDTIEELVKELHRAQS